MRLEVELTQTQRYTGRVAYELLVRLKDSAAAGYFNEQLVLVTNDEENPRIPIYVGGRIVPQISVAPESLMLGSVAHGQQVSKKVLVRGKTPFKIVSIQCDDEQACNSRRTINRASGTSSRSSLTPRKTPATSRIRFTSRPTWATSFRRA